MCIFSFKKTEKRKKEEEFEHLHGHIFHTFLVLPINILFNMNIYISDLIAGLNELLELFEDT